MAMSLAFISPTIGVIFISSLIAGKAGLSSPFIFIVGTLGIALMASTLAQFTRRITSAGTFYKFICQSFGTSTAFVAGMVLLLAYTLQSPLNTNLFGGFVSQTLSADFGIHVSWWILMVVIVIAVGALAWYSVHTSMSFDLAFVIAEVSVAGILLFLIIFKGGAHGQAPSSFLPTHSASGFGGLGTAFVFIVLAFFGFESSTTVAEETRNPRRNLPIALIGSVVLTGLWFTFAMYSIIVGYGSAHVSQVASATAPLHDLAVRYIGGWYGNLVDLAAVSAIIAVLLAIHTANFRVIYALGRDGVLHRALGRTHPRHQTPHVAIIVYSVFTLVIGLAAGAGWGPLPAFGVPRVPVLAGDPAGLHRRQCRAAVLHLPALPQRVLRRRARGLPGGVERDLPARHLAQRPPLSGDRAQQHLPAAARGVHPRRDRHRAGAAQARLAGAGQARQRAVHGGAGHARGTGRGRDADRPGQRAGRGRRAARRPGRRALGAAGTPAPRAGQRPRRPGC